MGRRFVLLTSSCLLIFFAFLLFLSSHLIPCAIYFCCVVSAPPCLRKTKWWFPPSFLMPKGVGIFFALVTLKSLLSLYFFYWNLCLSMTFLLLFLFVQHFSVEFSTFSSWFFLNLSFLEKTFEISIFSSLAYWIETFFLNLKIIWWFFEKFCFFLDLVF